MTPMLRYIGNGMFLPGIPTADHEEPDEDAYEAKIASGLYRPASQKEIRERLALEQKAKTEANAKASRIARAVAIEARAEAEKVAAEATQAVSFAQEAEERAAAADRTCGRK